MTIPLIIFAIVVFTPLVAASVSLTVFTLYALVAGIKADVARRKTEQHKELGVNYGVQD